MKPPTLLFTLLLGLSLSGCGALSAQNPSGSYTPVNAVATSDQKHLLLQGADVVAYFTEGQYLPGDPSRVSRHEGVTLFFASVEHQAAFEREPTRYLPQFGGYCANGIAYGIPWGGDADTWKIVDGKLYIFGGQGSKDAFELDEKGNLALANRYWNDEIVDNNSFIQRVKRLVWRVPHYQSGEALAKAVAENKAKAAQ
ncbi:MAG: YHS domain-containing (seleno)protein [Thiotrichales bacterium]